MICYTVGDNRKPSTAFFGLSAKSKPKFKAGYEERQ